VVTGIAPVVQWSTGSPLWGDVAADSAARQRPAILRFATDDFMPQLMKVLADRPDDLSDYVAEARSYRPRPPGAAASWSGLLPHVKLYQAAHGHFNLVAASLVCRMPGFPDKTLDVADREEVAFVLRRLIPPDPKDLSAKSEPVEAAWVDDPVEGRGWRTIAGEERRVAPGEELLTLFPLPFPAGAGRTRRLFVGLIPTSSADTFKASGSLSPLLDEDPRGTKIDARKDDFETRVIAPLESLRTAAKAPAPADVTDATKKQQLATAATDLREEASAFLLLDFAELLSTYMPASWAAIQTTTAPSSGPIASLYAFLQGSTAGSGTLRAAILDAWNKRLQIVDEGGPKPSFTIDLGTSTFSVGSLRSFLVAALPPAGPGVDTSPLSHVIDGTDEIPKLQPTPGTLFVVRCVFRRPCANPPSDLVGDASERFAIASFFDPDAPARTVRIQLPLKTSIADLRKYPKNVGFVLSDQLREQMSRVTDLKRMMDGQLASSDSFDIGLLCSFSIPIITIAALMALMIIIGLLNIVFWWAPFLRIGLPILAPGKRT
jgi:hypothetical protein